MRPAKPERTGFRDERISRLHREFGYDYPAVDIDFLLVEYDEGIPVALIEHKHERFFDGRTLVPSFSAVRALADCAHIPFFVVIYSNDLSRFVVRAMNSIALRNLGKEVTLTRERYERFLRWLRKGMPPRTTDQKSETTRAT